MAVVEAESNGNDKTGTSSTRGLERRFASSARKQIKFYQIYGKLSKFKAIFDPILGEI